MPRDRNGEFGPKLSPKYPRDISGIEEKVIFLYARGMSTRDIHDQLQDLYGIKMSAEMVSRITDKRLPEIREWQSRPLSPVYPSVFMDFNDYIQARLGLIKDYYHQGKISADEYFFYLEKHYKQELSYRDKVINAVTKRIDKEIDGLEKQKNDIEGYYKVQIDALEKQKTLLQEANKERQKQFDLQKAHYDLERARNQRTELAYSEGKGIHDVTKDSAIRDAQREAENAEFKIKIAEIEKAISKLEEARDAETDAIDDMIDKLKEYRDQWDDITSAYVEK